LFWRRLNAVDAADIFFLQTNNYRQGRQHQREKQLYIK